MTDHLQATFVWLKEDDGWFGTAEFPREHYYAVDVDTKIVLSLDPEKLADEYDRLSEVALSIGANYPADADLKESIRHLADWKGEAAEAFKRQIDMMETFCHEQQQSVLQGMQCLAAAYAVAIETRNVYYNLVMATEAAARNAKAEEQKEDTKFLWATVFNVASGVLDASAGNLRGTTIDTAVQIGKDYSQRVIEGDDSDQVMETYRRQADELFQSFGMSLDRITKTLGDRAADAEAPSPMHAPLPPICDVRGDAFKYEYFTHDVLRSGPVAEIVADEHRKYLEEKRAERDSEIGRRLGGRPV
ncbi:hypothetical protein LWC34_19315 [Kibdelosporangium philippinense]|uniref:WXG100 family type VII secretion target n=1 Tax=Kibdelosporangium philippinense TaxID=211113 RepID=A0ABS8ZCN4_9PSEU|nr:hypothetical protein [Kibdelosporangium philippinense]MCE7004959.1 hypothetical protein [Kibdelosporangium philippinense]